MLTQYKLFWMLVSTMLIVVVGLFVTSSLTTANDISGTTTPTPSSTFQGTKTPEEMLLQTLHCPIRSDAEEKVETTSLTQKYVFVCSNHVTQYDTAHAILTIERFPNPAMAIASFNDTLGRLSWTDDGYEVRIKESN